MVENLRGRTLNIADSILQQDHLSSNARDGHTVTSFMYSTVYPQTQVPREHKPSLQRRLCVLDPIALHSSRLFSMWRASAMVEKHGSQIISSWIRREPGIAQKGLSFGRIMICSWSWKGIFLTPVKHILTVACWQVFFNRWLTNTIFLTPMKHMIMACLSKLVPSRKNINDLLRWSTHLQTYPDDQSNDVSELGSNDISACHTLNAPTSDGVGSAFIHSWVKNRHLPVSKPQSIRDNSSQCIWWYHLDANKSFSQADVCIHWHNTVPQCPLL